MNEKFDRELAAYFTDVEHLREWFARWLTAKELPKRLLVIYGVGGVGKSSLLRMFRLHCKAQRVPVALASGDEEKSAVDVLARWAEDLRAGAVRLPAFDKTFSHYRALQAKVTDEAQKSRDKLAGLAGKAASKTAESVARTLAGATLGSVLPGIGTIVGALGGLGAEALVEWLRGFLKQPDIDLLLDPTKKLTEDFLADLAKAAERRRVVLMLDTFEQMGGLEDWTREVVQHLTGNVENVLLVIAGRIVPDWGRAWPTWMSYAQVEELKPMSEEDMRELARRYYATVGDGEPDSQQVETIIRFARGLPMVVTSAVQLWVRHKYRVEDFQAVKAEVVADFVDRLMEGVPKEMIPALEAAAVVRWFNQPILRAMLKQEDVRDVYNELRRFPFVRTRTERPAPALHDAVREIIDENLRVHDRERHRELHERAAAYFEVRLKEATGEEAERLKLELLYHRIRVNEKEGMSLFQEVAEELASSRFVSRLHALLNDVNTYPLQREDSRLWRKYYNARLMHLYGRLSDAEQAYRKILESPYIDKKLKAYVLSDLGNILSNFEYLKRSGGFDEAEATLRHCIELGLVDNKTVYSWISLAWVYRRCFKWDLAIECLHEALQYYEQTQNVYMKIVTLSHFLSFHALIGKWQDAIRVKKEALSLADSLPNSPIAKARLWGRWSLEIWIGNWFVAEKEYKRAVEIANAMQDNNLLNETMKRLGWVLGLQGRHDEAEQWFKISLEMAQNVGHKWWYATAIGFRGLAWINQDIVTAKQYLEKALQTKEELSDMLGIQELLNGLGLINEIEGKFQESERHYKASVDLKHIGRLYYTCGALIGLIRVKHAQKGYHAIPPLLAEAEQLAQQYEYNDHLASLRLTQGHIAWDGHIPKWGSGFDAALHYYQQALIYALRYNRFLLDEVLSGRPQGTPLRPIIPKCLKRGEEGRRMLIALRDWWQTGMNDVGAPRPDTISPIPEGIPLLEAERIAREREPGDGSPQKSVVEQIDGALKEMGAA